MCSSPFTCRVYNVNQSWHFSEIEGMRFSCNLLPELAFSYSWGWRAQQDKGNWEVYKPFGKGLSFQYLFMLKI